MASSWLEMCTKHGSLTVITMTNLVLLLALILFSWLFYSLFLHPLAAVPGPRHWAAASFFYTRSVKRGQYAQKSLELHAKYGPVVRVTPNEVSVTATEAWSIVYAYNAGTCFPKSANWFRARHNGTYGILASPNSEHGRFRRVFAQAFTETSLRDHAGIIHKHVDNLTTKLLEASERSPIINITDELEYVTFDIAGDFAYSRSFECLQKEDNRGQVRLVQTAMKIFTARAMRNYLGVDRLAIIIGNALTSLTPEKTPYHHALARWTQTRLTDPSEKEQRDLMDFVASSTRSSKTLLPSEAENAIGDFMIAGTETVSTTVAAALLYLTSNPATLKQLRNELLRAELTDPPTTDQLAQLPFLNAVVNETMRLAPSIPHTLPRTVPGSGTHIGGYFLPGGSGVSFNQYAAYRDPEHFSNPTRFEPGRWIEPGNYPKHDAAVFNPFSVGPRNCIGRQWGLRVVRALLARIVSRFNMCRAGVEWDWEDLDSSFVWEKRGLELEMRPYETD